MAPPSTLHGALGAWCPALDVDVLFCRWLLGVDADADRPSDDHEEDLLALIKAAATSDRAGSIVPRVPAVIPQLLQELRDPMRSTNSLARLVTQDPVLVAAVLRVANSAYYRTESEIQSVEQALLRLGEDGLRQLAASVAFKPIINVQSGRFTKLGAPRIWDQSEMCGAACRILAPAAGASGFEAYLGAMLLNTGTIVGLRILDQRFDGGAAPGSERFCAAFVGHARLLSASIGRQWEFPPAVALAVARQRAIAAAKPTPLEALLRACDQVSKLRSLVDAGCIAADDARLAFDDAGAIGRCFTELRARAVSIAARTPTGGKRVVG